ncbi:MAG: hypothetical protein Q9184_005961 [Pyrenodesmia sp. 2 TL-2023]
MDLPRDSDLQAIRCANLTYYIYPVAHLDQYRSERLAANKREYNRTENDRANLTRLSCQLFLRSLQPSRMMLATEEAGNIMWKQQLQAVLRKLDKLIAELLKLRTWLSCSGVVQV